MFVFSPEQQSGSLAGQTTPHDPQLFGSPLVGPASCTGWVCTHWPEQHA